MKKYIAILMVFAVALLFVTQSDALAKTQKQATAELNKVDDGLVYYQLKSPKTYNPKSKSSGEQETAPRFSKWFGIEIDAFQNRVDQFWHRIWLPAKYKNYKHIEVVD